MGDPKKVRQATQELSVRQILSRYLGEPQLAACLMELRAQMRSGPNAWAFKPVPNPQPVDDRVYYNHEGIK